MSNIILERYYFGAAILVLILILIAIFSAATNCINDKKRDKRIKKYFKIDFSVAILIISVASIWYQGAKEELIEKFNNNEKILCRHKQEFIVIKKDGNYTLEGKYFIKDGVAIYIDVCKSLEE